MVKSQYKVKKEQLAKIIKLRRSSLGITQQTLADLAGVGLNTIVAIERAEGNPRWETICRICDTMGLKIDIKLKD